MDSNEGSQGGEADEEREFVFHEIEVWRVLVG